MEPLGTIQSIGIVTAGRPALLRRALASILEHCDRHGRRPRVIVVDGSREPADRRATRAATEAVAAAGRVEYIGPDEATALGHHLGWPGDTAWPLVPGAAGINRNLLLLSTAGERVLMIDDDVLCTTWSSPDSTDRLQAMGPAGEWMHTAFFDTRAAALAAAARTDVSLLAAHEAVLGRPLVEPGSPHDTHERGRPPVAAEHCAPAATARVAATMAGVAGDAGIYCPYRLLLAGGPLRAHLTSSAATLATALGSREVHRIARCRAVTANPTCMATCIGLDNTTLSPPFPLVGANEDGTFGALLAMASPEARFAHLPVGIVHDSRRSSVRDDVGPRSAQETRLADLLIGWLDAVPRSGQPATVWIAEASSRLLTLAHLPPAELEAEARRLVHARRQRELAHVTRLADAATLPDHYRAAMAVYRDAVRANLGRSDFCIPVEFQSGDSGSASVEALARALDTLGHVMGAWPAVWDRARRRNTLAERRQVADEG